MNYVRQSRDFTTIALALVALSGCGDIESPRDWAGVRIALYRGGCFGSCPTYAVVIHGDGVVEYCGVQYVQQSGTHSRTIPEAQVRNLYRTIAPSRFSRLNDEYLSHASDGPTYQVSVTTDGRTKTVTDYRGTDVGMPKSVTEIENEIDRVAGTATWAQHSELRPTPTPDCRAVFASGNLHPFRRR